MAPVLPAPAGPVITRHPCRNRAYTSSCRSATAPESLSSDGPGVPGNGSGSVGRAAEAFSSSRDTPASVRVQAQRTPTEAGASIPRWITCSPQLTSSRSASEASAAST